MSVGYLDPQTWASGAFVDSLTWGEPVVVSDGLVDGAKWPVRRRRVKRRSSEDYERERRLLEEYLEALERRKVAPVVVAEEDAPQAEVPTVAHQPVVPRLTAAMARAAQLYELDAISQHEAAAVRDRAMAEEERRKRQRAAAAAVLMMSH